MANYKYVIYEKQSNIARITLNKPEKLNAYTLISRAEDAKDFYNALDEAAIDDDIKVVIIKGAGRAFSVGHDMTRVGFVYGFGTGQTGERRPSQRIRLAYDRMAMDDLINKLFLHPKITVAQVHGHCLGAGLIFLSLCDLAICAKDAVIGHTEQRLGFAGSGIPNTNVLIATIGLKRTLDLLLTGRQITGEEAEKMGLVNKSVPADKLEHEVEKLTKALCLLPRDGIAIGKATRHMAYDSMGLTAGLAHGYYSHSMFTNLRWESDEYNFFKERRDKSTKVGFHGRDDRYTGLV